MMETTPEGNYHNGAIPESCFPYQSSDDVPCSDKCEDWTDYLVPVLNCGELWVGFDNPVARETLKSQIFQNGPVAAGMNVTQDFIRFWQIHHDPTDYFPDTNEPCGNRLNHIIVIIGWKDDLSIDNGGYWICKNSWGTEWGYDGFYNIEYGGLFTGCWIAWVDYDPESFDWAPVANAGGFYQGTIGREILFDGSKSFDAENDIVSYKWNFGDGTNGTGVSPLHAYLEQGTYTVTLAVTDGEGKTATDCTVVGIEEPPIQIDISGGLGLTIVVRNPVEEELTDLEWHADLNGLLIALNTTEGIIASIPAEDEFTFEIPIIGLGPGIISVIVDGVSKTVNFFTLGPFVISLDRR